MQNETILISCAERAGGSCRLQPLSCCADGAGQNTDKQLTLNMSKIAVSIVKSAGAETKPVCTIELDEGATIGALKAAFAKQSTRRGSHFYCRLLSFNSHSTPILARAEPHYYASRQEFRLPLPPNATKGTKPVALKNDDEKLSTHAHNHQLTLVFKDLGAQISWRTVFLAPPSHRPSSSIR